jgi:ribosomal protein S27AE
MATDTEEKQLLIRYKCPNCGHRWHEIWSSACDSECGRCGTGDITALDWEELEDKEDDE